MTVRVSVLFPALVGAKVTVMLQLVSGPGPSVAPHPLLRLNCVPVVSATLEMVMVTLVLFVSVNTCDVALWPGYWLAKVILGGAREMPPIPVANSVVEIVGFTGSLLATFSEAV